MQHTSALPCPDSCSAFHMDRTPTLQNSLNLKKCRLIRTTIITCGAIRALRVFTCWPKPSPITAGTFGLALSRILKDCHYISIKKRVNPGLNPVPRWCLPSEPLKLYSIRVSCLSFPSETRTSSGWRASNR